MSRAECPRCCGGLRDFDEDGKPFTCFFCHDTGSVPAAVAAAFHRAEQDWAEHFAPRRLGIFALAIPYECYERDEAPAPAPGHRLFTRFTARTSIPDAYYAYLAATDDLPF